DRCWRREKHHGFANTNCFAMDRVAFSRPTPPKTRAVVEARHAGPQLTVETRAFPGRAGLSPYNKEMPVVLGVNPAVVVDGSWRIGCTNGQLLEDTLNLHTSLPDGVEIAVFAVGVDHAVSVYHRGIHAPLKAVGMVGNARDGAVGIAGAALGVGV